MKSTVIFNTFDNIYSYHEINYDKYIDFTAQYYTNWVILSYSYIPRREML